MSWDGASSIPGESNETEALPFVFHAEPVALHVEPLPAHPRDRQVELLLPARSSHDPRLTRTPHDTSTLAEAIGAAARIGTDHVACNPQNKYGLPSGVSRMWDGAGGSDLDDARSTSARCVLKLC